MLELAHHLPLARHSVLQSSSPDETRAFLAAKNFEVRIGAAAPHRTFRTSINAAYLPGAYLSTLRYGRQVEIAAREERSDYAVQIPLAGGFEARTGGMALAVGPGHGAIGLQREQVIRSDADCVRLSISIQHDTMVGQLAALLGDTAQEQLVFSNAIALDHPHFAGVVGLLRWALDELDRNPSLLRNRLVATHFEQLLITALLYGQDSNYRSRLEEPRGEICVGSVKRAVDYIEAHAAEPITLAELVAASGIAGRTLYKHFRLSKGVAPMAYLRRVRLRKARADLMRGDPAMTVTDIAERWGFDHLGRFAAEYRRCYGEAPSATLRRHWRT